MAGGVTPIISAILYVLSPFRAMTALIFLFAGVIITDMIIAQLCLVKKKRVTQL